MALAPAHPGPPGSPEGALREAQALSPLPAAPGPPTPARRLAGLAPGQDDDPLPPTVRGQSRGSERAQGHRSPWGRPRQRLRATRRGNKTVILTAGKEP